jgi:hypothetical protein
MKFKLYTGFFLFPNVEREKFNPWFFLPTPPKIGIQNKIALQMGSYLVNATWSPDSMGGVLAAGAPKPRTLVLRSMAAA